MTLTDTDAPAGAIPAALTDPAAMPVADPWFQTRQVAPHITLLWEPAVVRLLRANLYLIAGRDRNILVDTGMGVGDLRAALGPMLDKETVLFTTHTHVDHMGGHRAFTDWEIQVHPIEADLMRAPEEWRTLAYADYPESVRAGIRAAGFPAEGYLIGALPAPGWDPHAWRFEGVTPTTLVDEGAVIDTGDRVWEVLHLPGHSAGSIALWEAATGTLIAGDAVYDGILIDTLKGSSIPDYVRTMRRLRGLPVQVVHGGHKDSFDRARLVEIVDGYLDSRKDWLGGTDA